MITVLIPTAKRPDLLAKALQSVAEQTALNEIEEIVVSESAGDRRSEEVCRQFPQLPIRYIFRDPQLQMTEHFSVLKKAKWTGDYTAILHDDDWWAPEFLSRAIHAFATHPQSSAYCCSSYYIIENTSIFDCGSNECFWIGADFPPFQPVWELTMQDVFLACLLGTPAQYSTIVARSGALRKAAIIYDTGNTWDADRMLLFELSKFGTLMYSPLPYAFYLFHSKQLTHSYSLEMRERQNILTSKWLVEQSGETWNGTGHLISERFRRCPEEAKDNFKRLLGHPACLPLLAEYADAFSGLAQLRQALVVRTSLPFWKRMIKLLIPPIIIIILDVIFTGLRPNNRR